MRITMVQKSEVECTVSPVEFDSILGMVQQHSTHGEHEDAEESGHPCAC